MTPPKDATAGEALKPCPFGCKAHPFPAETGSAYNRFAVNCPTCFVAGPRRDTMEGAIAAWNLRPSADPAAVEAARRVVDGRQMHEGDTLKIARALLSTSLEAGEIERLRPDDGPPGSPTAGRSAT